MSDDDRFDNWIGEAARDYNAPSEVPREEMWAAIASELETRNAGAEAPGRGDRIGRPSPLALRSSVVWRAAAAMALVAAGLAGGYWLRGPAPPAATVVAAVDSTEGISGTLNQVMAQHFTDAEALLVAFRGRTELADADAISLGRWARDVLGTTRLLLDSPAASAPLQRRLLEDLELILVQIANLSSRAPADELQLTTESLTREQLLTRLRSTIPAGVVSGT